MIPHIILETCGAKDSYIVDLGMVDARNYLHTLTLLQRTEHLITVWDVVALDTH
jgi:hypothetical protein